MELVNLTKLVKNVNILTKTKVLEIIEKRIERLQAKIPEHIKILPEEAREEVERESKIAFNFATIELEALKEEISELKDVHEVLDECRVLRGIPEQLRHRTFIEFGAFIRDMVDFLVFGIHSNDKDVRKFQDTLNRMEWNPEDFNTYIRLFHLFWKNWSRSL